MRQWVVLPMLILMSSFWSQRSFADAPCPQEASAKIISLQGEVAIDSKASGEWQGAGLDQTLCEGDRVWVKPNSRVSLGLPGNDVLRLNENTVLTLKAIDLNKQSLLDIVKGFIHFIARKPREVKIESGIANAAPFGTEFAFKVDESKAELWVYEGGVQFYNQYGSVKLKSGQAAEAYLGKAPQIRIDLKPQDAVNWALYYPPLLPKAGGLKAADPAISAAITNYKKGRIDLALQRLDALPTAQQTPYFHKVRGAMRLIVGQVDLAKQDIKAIASDKPNDADALALQAVIALTQNRKDEAFDLANKAILSDPQSATAYTALSYAEQGRFNLDKALEAANTAVKHAPNDAMVLAHKAELEFAQGLVSDSEETAQQAIRLDADLERTQTVKGFSHLMSMDTDEAKQAFNKAIALDSAAPLPRLGLGLAKIRDGDLEAGRKDIEISANLDPNNSLVRSYLGKAYYEEKRSDSAEEQFKLAKERDSKDPTPYFYDAIKKQTENMPIEALEDLQKAAIFNGNRAVYRSKFLLDEDAAMRQVGLGRIFTNLGFDDPAARQAMLSLALDPINYSAHRLLSDSYATKPFHEISRSSELLQSQLLQPLNYNPIQPSLAYTDLNIMKGIGPNSLAFNEYNRLFERDGIRFTTTGIAGSNSTFGDETALSGIYKKFSYSLGQLHYDTNGFRQNNDLKHNIYNFFSQYEVSPIINLQAEYRHRETEHGDLELQGDNDFFDKRYRRKLDQDTYRFGIKFSPDSHSDVLVSLIHANRKELVINSNGNIHLLNGNLNTDSYNFDTQYLFHNDFINTIAGVGIYRTDNDGIQKNTSPTTKCPCLINYNTTQYFGYQYSNFKLLDNLNVTAGLSYDKYKDNQRFKKSPSGKIVVDRDEGADINEINPKFGFIWKANEYFSFRGAAFQTVKSAIIDNQILQPSQIAGFNQFFDYRNGTAVWQYGIGLDGHFSKNIYSGIEASKRELKLPTSTTNFDKAREELYRFYFNWVPLNYLAVNTEFRFENFRGFDASPTYLETAYIPLEIRYFNNNGFFAALRGTYVDQKMIPSFTSNGNFKSDFYIIDASIGYRFPKQYGLVSFDVKNLFDTNFNYRDRQFIMNEQRSSDLIPERALFGRLTLNF